MRRDLRASEVTRLKVCDIDSNRMVMRVEHGKGGKERYVMLSKQLLACCAVTGVSERPERFLFPGRPSDKPIDPMSCTWPAVRRARRPVIDKTGQRACAAA